MNYFFDCATKEEAKVKYRKLAKEFHPDKGGKASDMKALQEQYDNFSEHDHKSYFKHPFENESEQAFKDNIRNAFRQQNSNTHYHQYTNSNEVQRLRDENHMLRGNIYQLESLYSSLKNNFDMNTFKFNLKINNLNQEILDLKRFRQPSTRFEALLHFIYFIIKGKPMEFENEE